MSRSERIMDVLTSASEMPPEERTAHIEAACGGDAALRAEVESLLRSHDAGGRFLSQATVDIKPGNERGGGAHVIGLTLSGAAAASSHEHEGQMIGRYKLLQVIGEGGFGTVWMAEQREPVKRRVALKIIKLGMDTRQVITRFEAERQALAMMDHPSIAKVFDAGSTETGRPYFVMEYIKGVPILEHCESEDLSIEARLTLFAQICQAIHHAHQKGVIHRDIKPGNVLVTMHDGVPVPKVIDFGIAKATSAELTQKTLFTEHRQIVGTPAYMSPEQAEMSGLDIDTRSDIYSLGVLLYELLTGTTPFTAQELLSAGLAEMVRIIREVEPPKPSTKLSTMGQAASRTFKNRAVGVSGKRAGVLQRDLDWIVMKCLEKNRTRRYESASSLAMDISRYLSDEPVSAGPPTAAYRLQKFAKRHRGMVIASAAVGAMLVLGIAGTGIGLAHALTEQQRAVAEAARAESARQEEAKARARAEVITEFVTTALRSADAQNLGEVDGAGQDMTILAAMEAAARDIQSGRFKDDPEIEAELLSIVAQILRNNGRVNAAEPLVERALEINRKLNTDESKLARSMEHLAVLRGDLGRMAEAESLMREVLAIRRRLHTGTNTDLAGTLQILGSMLDQQGKLEEAEAISSEALSLSRESHRGDHTEVAICLNNLALVKQNRGDAVEAEKLFVEALDMHRRLYPGDHPEVAAGWNNLGFVYAGMGRPADAESALVKAVEMRQRLFKGDHHATALTLANLAAVRQRLRKYAEAETASIQALEMQRRLFHGDHPSVAVSLTGLASVREGMGKLAEAETLHVEALEMSRRVAGGDNLDTAFMLNNLAMLRRKMGRVSEAEPLLNQALRIREEAFKADHPLIVATLRNLATVLAELHRESESAELTRRADEMAQRLSQKP